MATKKVDYEKSVNKFAKSGADKVNRATGTMEKMRHMPEAGAKIAAGMVARPFAAAASGVVNKYRDVAKNTQSPSIYSRTDDGKTRKSVSPAPMRTADKPDRHYKGRANVTKQK